MCFHETILKGLLIKLRLWLVDKKLWQWPRKYKVFWVTMKTYKLYISDPQQWQWQLLHRIAFHWRLGTSIWRLPSQRNWGVCRVCVYLGECVFSRVPHVLDIFLAIHAWEFIINGRILSMHTTTTREIILARRNASLPFHFKKRSRISQEKMLSNGRALIGHIITW